MYARLAFAVATHVDPEILLIDEILSVGDEHFGRKSATKMEEFRKAGKTILLVTHDLTTLQRRCDQAAWLDAGVLKASGSPVDVVAAYRAAVAESEVLAMEQHVARAPDPVQPRSGPPAEPGRRWGSFEAELSGVEIHGRDGPQHVFSADAPFRLLARYRRYGRVEAAQLELSLRTDGGTLVWSSTEKLPDADGGGAGAGDAAARTRGRELRRRPVAGERGRGGVRRPPGAVRVRGAGAGSVGPPRTDPPMVNRADSGLTAFRVRQVLAWALPLAVLGALSVRTLGYVRRYSVDLIFWDQWDFLEPVFRGAGPWTQFDWQHGPHRQGVGGLLLAVLLPATGWSIRAQAVASALIVIAAAAMAWVTLRRATGAPSWTDVSAPLLCLGAGLEEVFVGASNPAHGPVPMALVFAIALAWTARSPLLRAVLAGVLGGLCVFTGFGFFVGLVQPVLFAAECGARERRRAAPAGRGAGGRSLGRRAPGVLLGLAAHHCGGLLPVPSPAAARVPRLRRLPPHPSARHAPPRRRTDLARARGGARHGRFRRVGRRPAVPAGRAGGSGRGAPDWRHLPSSR